jgi:hypothetical protein
MVRKSAIGTYHEGVYRRTPKAPRFDGRALGRLLVQPRRAFEDLYDHTSVLTGGGVAIAIIVNTAMLNLFVYWFVFESSDVYTSTEYNLSSSRGIFSIDPIWTGLFLAGASFFLTSGIVYGLVRAGGDAKRPNPGKTLGLLGYAMFPAFLIGIVMAIVVAVFGADIIDYEEAIKGAEGSIGAYELLEEFQLIYYALVVVMLLWGLRTHAAAASVANDSAPGRTLGLTLAAWVLSYTLLVVAIQAYYLVFEGGFAEIPWLPLM